MKSFTPREPGTWSELSRSARALRIVHLAIAVLDLSSLAYVWTCALRRRRDRWLGVACAVLFAQGIGVLIGRGNCPLGPLQQRLGDPRPLFELVFPPRVAKAIFPVLLVVTLGGVLGVALRPPARAKDR